LKFYVGSSCRLALRNKTNISSRMLHSSSIPRGDKIVSVACAHAGRENPRPLVHPCKWSEREADYLIPYSSEFKNAWTEQVGSSIMHLIYIREVPGSNLDMNSCRSSRATHRRI
jgi:hypothetical protein